MNEELQKLLAELKEIRETSEKTLEILKKVHDKLV